MWEIIGIFALTIKVQTISMYRKQDFFAGKPKRVFHQRFTLAAKCGIAICVLLMFYFFWVKAAIVSLFLLIIAVGIMERVFNTTYTIGESEGQYFLLVEKGRFSFPTMLPVSDITRLTPMRRLFGLSRYLLVEYGQGRLLSVEPDDEDGFVAEIKKRQTS